MISWNRSPRWVAAQLLGIFVVALALRGGVAVSSVHVPIADETSYDETGWSIATGHGYVLEGKPGLPRIRIARLPAPGCLEARRLGAGNLASIVTLIEAAATPRMSGGGRQATWRRS